ncbi:MAG: 3-deoxy-manno-octulosonate cytidylyltransferase [Ruminococcus sp.]|jgi:3-deoxy-manno-octulosonate cytidylyltransferase (CMP-KDO synthetase)
MRTVLIIPARYNSSRLKGKPLMEIEGKPMVWWVYQQMKKSARVDEIYVATDSEKIQGVCADYGMNCMMTSPDHKTSTERLYEVSKSIPGDIYICVNGDEPLLEAEVMEQVIPENLEGFFVSNLMTAILHPVEAVDDSNIKVVTDTKGNALFMSRSPIPHPKASILFSYYKHLGVLAYSPNALRFFAETPRGPLEAVEDINELRFIEHGKKVKMIPVEAETLSVDTAKDLEYVRQVIRERSLGR